MEHKLCIMILYNSRDMIPQMYKKYSHGFIGFPFISSIIDTVMMQYYDSTIIETKIKSYFPADINYILYVINIYTIYI